jgi:hypothetical protein
LTALSATVIAGERGISILEKAVEAPPMAYGWREVSGGVDAGRDQWLIYSGTTVAPWANDIYSNGWRLRIGGGYGQYSYARDALENRDCGTVQTAACVYRSQRFRVDHSYAEVLLGYYVQLGELTVKAFAGGSMSSEKHQKPDADDGNDGVEYGAKGALELWLNDGDKTWASLDLSHTTARNETSARWRAGRYFWPALSLGPELRYDKNIESGDGEWNGRAGLFVRYAWTSGEVSLAGGISERMSGFSSEEAAPYGTVNFSFQY